MLDLNQQPAESNLLHYHCATARLFWWTEMDLHHRHRTLQVRALLAELPVQMIRKPEQLTQK